VKKGKKKVLDGLRLGDMPLPAVKGLVVGKVGKRQYLKKELEREFTDRLNKLFISTVEVPRVKVGRRQEVESLISEEALMLAKFVRNEIKEWKPRIPELL
jgi:23S rRNA pseudoU1915 N3-methylase RlmH